MRKLMLMAIVGFALCAVQANAQRVTTEEKVAVQDQPDEKVRISVEELPDAIKTALENDSYKGWSIEGAQYNKTKDIYEVEVRKGTEAKTIKFTKDGNIVE